MQWLHAAPLLEIPRSRLFPLLLDVCIVPTSFLSWDTQNYWVKGWEQFFLFFLAKTFLRHLINVICCPISFPNTHSPQKYIRIPIFLHRALHAIITLKHLLYFDWREIISHHLALYHLDEEWDPGCSLCLLTRYISSFVNCNRASSSFIGKHLRRQSEHEPDAQTQCWLPCQPCGSACVLVAPAASCPCLWN